MCVDWLTGPNLSCIIKFISSSSQNYSGTLNTTTNSWLQWLNLVLHISICPGNRGHFNGWMWMAPRWRDGFPAASQGFGLLLPSSLSAHLCFQVCRPFPSFVICVPYKGDLRWLALLSVFCARTVKTLSNHTHLFLMTTYRAVREERQTGGPSWYGVGYRTSVTRNGVPALWEHGYCPFLFRTLSSILISPWGKWSGRLRRCWVVKVKITSSLFFGGEGLLFSFFEFCWILFWILLFE